MQPNVPPLTSTTSPIHAPIHAPIYEHADAGIHAAIDNAWVGHDGKASSVHQAELAQGIS